MAGHAHQIGPCFVQNPQDHLLEFAMSDMRLHARDARQQ